MRYVPVFLVLVGLEVGCAGGGPLMTSAPIGNTPPTAVAHALDSRWKGAKLAMASPTASCSSHAVQQTQFVSGDFNGDGASDVAMVVQTPAGLKVVAAMNETYDYALDDVPATGDLTNATLSVQPRGATYGLKDVSMDDYFGADTIVVTPCGQPPTAYVWNGVGFMPESLAP